MAEQAEPRLIEGPICNSPGCGRALDMVSTLRMSEGSETIITHRDGPNYDKDHRPTPAYRVLRP